MAVQPSPKTRDKLYVARQFILISGLAGVIVAAMALPFVSGAAFATKQATATYESLPNELKEIPLPQRSYMVDSEGQKIANLYSENRIVVPLARISPLIQKAAIATEDARFYEHHGVDLKGSARALLANSQAGETQQGSSTITMQYVRNLLITNAKTQDEIEQARARTISRKLQEMRYAIALEKKLTKDQILAGYLNVSYFGAGAYGVEAASRRYFSLPNMQVSLPQAALLAGLVQQPVGYDPTRNPELAQVRRDVVLDRMAAMGAITRAQAIAAKRTPIQATLKPQAIPNGCASSYAPFYCDYVIQTIKNDPRYGATYADREELLRRGGIVIRTAMSRKAMEAASSAVDSYLPADDESRKAAAIAMVEPSNGNILAMAQNKKWGTKGPAVTTYNYAVDAANGGTIGMQAGSVFKAFTLAAALEKGLDPDDYIDSPQTKTFAAGDWGCGNNVVQPPYEVNNSTGSGSFNMKSATARSINTYFVELQREAGLCRTINAAERLGVRLGNGQKVPRYPSFTLGSMEVSPLTVAAAYAGIANHGVFCEPRAVTMIENLNGTPIVAVPDQCRQALTRDVADGVTALLTEVIDGNDSGRTGKEMSLGRDAAGKTGTTDSNAAVWFAGYTPEIAAAVWAGDPRGGFKYPMSDIVINGEYYDKVHGSSLPGPIWRDAMFGALADTPASEFELEAADGLDAARHEGSSGRSYRGYNYYYNFRNYND